jgi:hypothetical protein
MRPISSWRELTGGNQALMDALEEVRIWFVRALWPLSCRPWATVTHPQHTLVHKPMCITHSVLRLCPELRNLGGNCVGTVLPSTWHVALES